MRERKTYNKANDDDVPASVDHVHLPPDVGEPDGHDEDEDESAEVSAKRLRGLSA